MTIPSERWFNRMNKLFVENKLEENPTLKLKYGRRYGKFKEFCFNVMDKFGWQDIEEIQREFDNETFYGLKFQRISEKNIRKWKKISKFVFERDQYTCRYCKRVGGVLEVDHVIPFSKGGSDDLDNLVTSCRTCNRQKKNKTVAEFINWRKLNE